MSKKSTILSLAVLIALSFTLMYCNDHRTFSPTAQIQLVTTLTGAGEKPTPAVSAATGSFVGVIDRATRVLSYTVTYSGLTPTMGHLHRINAANGTGPVEIPFPSLASPIVGTTTLATSGRVDSLINGFYYANLHTPAYPRGRDSGQCPGKWTHSINGCDDRSG